MAYQGTGFTQRVIRSTSTGYSGRPGTDIPRSLPQVLATVRYETGPGEQTQADFGEQTQAVEERQVTGHVCRRVSPRAVGERSVRRQRLRGEFRQLGEHRGKVDDADLVRAGVSDDQCPVVRAPGRAPRVGRTAVWLLQRSEERRAGK